VRKAAKGLLIRWVHLERSFTEAYIVAQPEIEMRPWRNEPTAS